MTLNPPDRSDQQSARQDVQSCEEHTPVLIVGGGLVGLSAALFLQRQGLPFILVEQRETPSILPRARGIHGRSMELFRQVGLEDDLQAAAAAAWKVGSFGGARRGETMLTSEPIAHFSAGMMAQLADSVPSPSRFCACPQDLMEPVLREALVARGGDVRFGQRLEGFTQNAEGVTATVVDARGQVMVLRADYLIAADGGRSLVRHALHTGSDRTEALQHYLNIYFRADLTGRMDGRTFSQCEIENEEVKGLMISKDNATEWSFHLEYDPQTTDPLAFSGEDLIRFTRSALGDPQLLAEVPVEILVTSVWSTAVRVARQYRDGRIFLVGDAAHVMPPWGGFNGNTGIADAHNLSWKLAEVQAGRAGDALLDSYETERHPFAVRNGAQARLRTDFEMRFNIETPQNHEFFGQLVDMNTLHLKYPYPEPEGAPGAPNDQPVEQLTAQLGTRFPHAWLRRGGERLSTLDLFGGPWVLLLGPGARPGEVAAPEHAQVVQLGREVRFADAETDWARLTGLPDDGAVLVRPDGVVGQRWAASGSL